jgi:hypothetical protein
VTTLNDFIGGGLEMMAFGHFLLGSHNFMVTALGSCVKWPYDFDPPISLSNNVEIPYHDNNLILTLIISPQSG